MSNRAILIFLLISFSLVGGLLACTPAQSPVLSTTPTAPVKPPVELPALNKVLPLNQLEGELTSSTHDDLRFTLVLPKPALSTQSINIGDIGYLRLWVKGTGIDDRVWNDEGLVKVVANATELSITKVPRGPNRIVTAQPYDTNKNPIPGLQLKAIYSSPPLTAGNIKVKIKLGWRFVPVGAALEQLLAAGSPLLSTLNPEQLQAMIDPLIFGANPVSGNTFAVHPSRISPTQIANTLKNGGLPASLPATWNPPATTATLYVKNALNTNFNSNISVFINDPASTAVVIPAGNDQANVTGVAPGTWTATVKIDGLNGGVTANANVTVSESGTITLSSGTLGNPFKLPPVITGATAYSTSLPRFLLSRWDGETTATDGISGTVGVLKNGAGYAAGWQGQGFGLNGINHYVEMPNTGGRYDFNATQDFSFGAWFKTASGTLQSIVAKEDGNKPTWGVVVRADGKLESAFQSAGSDGPTLTSVGAYNDNKWHHVMVTVNRTTNQATMILDGNQETLTGAVPAAADFTELATAVLVGARIPAAPDRFFNGSVDEVQIYKKAVSAAEVLNIYRNGSVSLTGDGFDPVSANNTVNIGGVGATVTGGTGTSLNLTPAPALSGNQTVSVTTATLNSNNGSVSVAAPLIAGVSNTSGAAGASVTITGMNFAPVAGNNTVTFNGVTAAVTAAAANALTVTVPAGFTSGMVSVTTNGGTATSNQTFTTGAPVIGGFPANAMTLQSITITGSNFDRENPANNQVTFNGAGAVAASSVSSDGTSLTVTVPFGATTGTFSVNNGAGTTVSGGNITLTAVGTVKWTAVMGAGTFSSPAIATDGTVYIGAGSQLRAYNPDGTLKWNYATGNTIESSPSVGADGTIYVGSYDTKIYAINPNGTLKWSYTTGNLVLSSPAIAPDGTIYVGSRDDKLYALNPNGTLKWSYTGLDNFDGTASVGPDGTIYVGNGAEKLYALNPDGTLKWSFGSGSVANSISNWSGSAIGTDGTIYAYASNNRLYALNPNGTQKWIYTAGNRIWSGPAIGADGTIYVGSWDNKVHAVNPDGTVKWTYTTGGQIDGGIAIGNDGLIYVGSQDGKVYALKADGTQQWNFTAAAGISYSTPNIASDGTLYVGTINGRLHAIRTGSTGLANTIWPKDRQNNANNSLVNQLALTSFTPGSGAAGTSVAIYGNKFTGATAVKFNGINATGFTVDSDNKITATVPAGNTIGTISVTTAAGTVNSASSFGAGILNWSTAAAGGIIQGNISIGSDGTIYVGLSGKVNAYNPDGTLKWSYNTGCDNDRSVSIANDGTIYTNCNNASAGPIVRALNPNGTLRWNAALNVRTEVVPVIGGDGTIYVGDYPSQSVYAYNPDGTQKWSRFVGGGGATSVIIGPDGSIYAQINSGIYNFDQNTGTIRWNYPTGANGGNWGSAAMGADGTIYAASTGANKIYAVRANGTLKWEYTGTGYILEPVLGADGTVYAGDTSGKIYALDSNGVLKWTYQAVGGIPGQTAAAVGNDGLIYFGTSSGNLYALNPDGTLAWSYNTGAGISSSPAIGANNNTVYIGNDAGKVFAISTSSTGYANSPWPRNYATNDSKGVPNFFHVSYPSPSSGNVGATVKIYGNRFTGATSVKFANVNAAFTVDSDTQITATVPVGAMPGKISVTTAAGTANSTADFAVVLWTYNAGAIINTFTSTPAISPDGNTLYVSGYYNQNLYALNRSTGAVNWTKNISVTGFYTGAPSVAADGTIYVGSGQGDGRIFAVNPDSTTKWTYLTDSDSTMTSAIDATGDIYFGDWTAGKMYSLTAAGALKWKVPAAPMATNFAYSGPIIPPGGGSVYITGGTTAHQVNPANGAISNTFIPTGPGISFTNTGAVASDGTVYYYHDTGNLYARNPNLTLKWTFMLSAGVQTASPVIGADGTIYMGSRDDKFYAVNPNGTLKWNFTTGNDIYGAAAIDSNGVIYVGSGDDYLYAFNADGTVKWKLNLGADVVGNPTISNDGVLYIRRTDGVLYAIPTGSTGLANSDWPKVNKNVFNNGRY